ncbi:hypothetical protein BH20ACT1_BH20ACT1_14380 [soil metagenome]
MTSAAFLDGTLSGGQVKGIVVNVPTRPPSASTTRRPTWCLDGEMLATALRLASSQETLDGDATLVVTDPSGRTFTSEAPIRHPRPPPELFAASG